MGPPEFFYKKTAQVHSLLKTFWPKKYYKEQHQNALPSLYSRVLINKIKQIILFNFSFFSLFLYIF